jgi:hypothetical protein
MFSTYNTIIFWVSFNHLEFYRSHTASNQEQVAFTNRSVCFKEIWLQVGFEEIASESFNSIVNGKNVDSLAKLDIWARVDADNISKTNTQVIANNFTVAC